MARPVAEEQTFPLGSFLITSAFTVFNILVLLALLSYHPDDAMMLEGGLSQQPGVRNFIGILGARVADGLVHWLGLAAWPGTVLLLACLARRLFGKTVRAFDWIYLGGLSAVIVGASLLLGVYPDFLAGVTTKLNIADTPGGVLGQRFCAPWRMGYPTGWLSYVVNRPGSIIIAGALMVTGIVTIWYYDWQHALKAWLVRFRAQAEEAKVEASEREEDNKKAAEDEKKRFEEERAKAELEREEKIRQQLEVNEAARKKAEKATVTSSPKAALPSSKRENLQETNSPAPRKRKPKAGSSRKFVLPSLKLLDKASAPSAVTDPREIGDKAKALQETLDSFGIDAIVGETTTGPRVTLFEIKPAPGVKVQRISSLQNNIAMVLKAESLRILAPIPGKDTVGIEVPNSAAAPVFIREMYQHSKWTKHKGNIPIVLGKDIKGSPVILDLARAPHLLIAGATGSGKSVCMNTLILSLLYKFGPDDLKMIMVDPKVVELSGYNSLPHLVTPVITEPAKAQLALNWAVNEMERRYHTLAEVGARNLEGFNSRTPVEGEVDKHGEPIPAKFPYLVVIVDELADLMMASKESRSIVETSLARIAQKARAVGIHAVIATQRPDVKVITGTIKANFPTRIAFQVTSVVDSRTILDAKGAESLLGRGDMLFNPPGSNRSERTQGALVQDHEIEAVVEFVSSQVEQEFVEDIFKSDAAKAGAGGGGGGGAEGSEMEDKDEALIQRAIEVILQDRRATTSHVQRRLRIGYNRAATVIETLEQRGMIGPQLGTAPREILMSADNAPTAAEDDQESTDDDNDE